MPEFWRRAWPWLASAAVVGFVWLCHGDYGITWDESVQDTYGELTRRYYASGGKDRSAERFVDLRYYGPMVEVALAALSGNDRTKRFDRRHMWLGLFAVPVVGALGLFARGFACWQVGAYGVLCLWMMPIFVGHLPNNSKDAPFAVAVAMYMAALFFLLRSPVLRPKNLSLFALALAAVLCVRPAGIVIAGLYGLAAFLLARLLGVGWPAGAPRHLLPAVGKLSISVAAAWFLMVASWPWTHAEPFTRPLRAIAYATAFPRIHRVLFEGTVRASDQLPWYYLPKYLLITTPPILLALALLGVGAQLWRFGAQRPEHRFSWLLTVIWLTLPIVLVMAFRPNIYDGMRHFIFLLPALGLLAGLGAVSLARRLTALAPRLGVLPWVFALVLCGLPLAELAALHPYQSSYHNFLVGGLPGAFRRYPLDYWGSSLREAVIWINEQSATSATPNRPATVLLGVPSTYPNAAAAYYAAPHVSVLSLPNLYTVAPEGMQFEYYLAPLRYDMELLFSDSPIVHAVARDGIPLSIVRRLNGMRLGERPRSDHTDPTGETHGFPRK